MESQTLAEMRAELRQLQAELARFERTICNWRFSGQDPFDFDRTCDARVEVELDIELQEAHLAPLS